MKFFLTTTFLLLLSLTLTAQIYVASDASGSNNGSSWANAFTNLQDALDAVSADYDEVWIKAGTYYPNKDIGGNLSPSDSRTKVFYIPTYITILRGGFNGTETLGFQSNPSVNFTYLDGDLGILGDVTDNAYSILKINSGSADCIGIYFRNADCTNAIGIGEAAVVNLSTSTANGDLTRLFDCTFTNNYSGYRGGAVYCPNAELYVEGSNFTNNSAADQGGAIYSSNNVQLNGCYFSNNYSQYGGAIKIQGYQDNRVEFCTFVGNSALRGAAIQAYNAQVTVNNSTFYENTDGGYGEFSIYDCGNFFVNNSLITHTAGNTTPLFDVHNGNNVFAFSTCMSNLTFPASNTSNCTNEDPLFVNAPTNLTLQSCSPAINNSNAVSASYISPIIPQEGNQRELGAREYHEVVVNNGFTSLYLANSYPAEPNSWQWIDCATNLPILGETNTSFIPTYSSDFALIAVFTNCNDTSNCVSFSATSAIHELKKEFTIYPNPAHSQLYIDAEFDTDIQVLNAIGQEIKRITLKSGKNIIEVENLNPGIYFIRSNEKFLEKFIKQ